jgi:hypothetical protein
LRLSYVSDYSFDSLDALKQFADRPSHYQCTDAGTVSLASQ